MKISNGIRGANVRIITDDECSNFNETVIYELALKGIPCTVDKNKRILMHNKFAIIDG